MRTRAIASLRRPVPSALPVTTGLRAGCRSPASAAVSVVYSDTNSPASSAVSTLAPSASSCVPVDSATVPSSYFLMGSDQGARLAAVPRRGAAGPAGSAAACAGGRRLLVDLLDLERGGELRLVRVVRPGVHLELA